MATKTFLVNSEWTSESVLPEGYTWGVNAFATVDNAVTAAAVGDALTIENRGTAAATSDSLNAAKLESLVLSGDFSVKNVSGSVSVANGSAVTASGTIDGSVSVTGSGTFTASSGLTGTAAYGVVLDANTDASTAILTVKPTAEATVTISGADGFTASGMYKLSDPTALTTTNGAVGADYSLLNYSLSESLTSAGYSIVKTVNGVFMTTEKYDMSTIVASAEWATGYEIGDKVTYEGKEYVFGYNAFATIPEALATAKYNYDNGNSVKVLLADSEYILDGMKNGAFNTAYYGNFTIDSNEKVVIYAGGWDGWAYGNNDGTMGIGEKVSHVVFGENVELHANGRVRFAGTIDIYGTVLSDSEASKKGCPCDDVFVYYGANANYCINIYSTGTFGGVSPSYPSGVMKGNINVIGNGESFRDTAQWIMPVGAVYENWQSMKVQAETADTNAGTVKITDYGYAKIDNSLGFGTVVAKHDEGAGDSQLIMDDGKLYVGNQFYFGYTGGSSTAGYATADIQGNSQVYTKAEYKLSNLGVWKQAYTATFEYGKSMEIADGGTFDIDFTGLTSSNSRVGFAVINGMNATDDNTGFSRITYSIDGVTKNADEIKAATGYTLYNDGMSVALFAEKTTYTDVVINSDYTACSKGNLVYVTDSEAYGYGYNAYATMDDALSVIPDSGATITNTNATAAAVTDLKAGEGLTLKGAYTLTNLTGALTVGNGGTVSASGTINGSVTVVGGGSFTATSGLAGTGSYSIVLDENTDATLAILTVKPVAETTITVSCADGFTATGMYKLSDSTALTTTSGAVNANYSLLNYSLSSDLTNAGYGIVKTVSGVFMTTETYDMTTIVANDQWATGYNIGDEVTYRGKTYVFGYNAFATFQEAIATAKYNYDPNQNIDVIAASDFILESASNSAFNFAYYSNITVKGDIGGSTTIKAFGFDGWTSLPASDVTGERGQHGVIAENLTLNIGGRIRMVGEYDVYGTIYTNEDYGTESFVRGGNADYDFKMTIHDTASVSFARSQDFCGNIIVLGDGKAVADNPQFLLKDGNYSNGWKVTTYFDRENAGTIEVKDYGYAKLTTAVYLGSTFKDDNGNVVAPEFKVSNGGKLELAATGDSDKLNGALFVGYTNATTSAGVEGKVSVTDKGKLIVTALKVGATGTVNMDYTSTLTYRDSYYTDTKFAKGSFEIADGGTFDIDFTGMTTESGRVGYVLVNGNDATGDNTGFNKITYSIDGVAKNADDIKTATGYTLYNTGRSIYAYVEKAEYTDVVINSDYATGYSKGDLAYLTDSEAYFYGVNAYAKIDDALTVIPDSGATITNTNDTAVSVTDLTAGSGLTLKGAYTVANLTGALTVGNGGTVYASGTINGSVTVVGGGSFTAAEYLTGTGAYNIVLDANTDADQAILTVNNTYYVETEADPNYDNYVATNITINVSAASGFTATGTYKLSDPVALTAATGQVTADLSKITYSLSSDLTNAGYGIVKTVNGVFMTTETYDMSTIVANADWADSWIGEEVELNGKTYVFGYNAFASIEDALATAKYNYASDKTITVLVATDYTLTTAGSKALNLGNIGNITLKSGKADDARVTIDAAGVWAYAYVADRTSTVCGVNGSTYTIAEDVDVINRSTRFAAQGVINIAGTLTDVGSDPFFRSYDEADYKINVLSTGTWSVHSVSGVIGGHINVTGDGKAFRDTAQLQMQQNYAGVIAFQDKGSITKENAATLTISDYGYAKFENSVVFGSQDGQPVANLSVNKGKLEIATDGSKSPSWDNRGDLLLGYVFSTVSSESTKTAGYATASFTDSEVSVAGTLDVASTVTELNISNSTLTAAKLVNNSTINVSGNSKLVINETTGNAINVADGTILTDSTASVIKMAANSTLTLKGTNDLQVSNDASSNTTLILQGTIGNCPLSNVSNVKWDLTAGAKDLSFDYGNSYGLSNTSFTIQGAKEGIAAGDYTLATEVATFTDTVTVTGFTDTPATISVAGGAAYLGDYTLTLAISSDYKLTLTVAGPPSVDDATRMTAIYADDKYESGKTFKIGYNSSVTSDYFKVANGTSEFKATDFQISQAMTDAGYSFYTDENTGDIFLKRANTKPTDIYFNAAWADETAGTEVEYTLKDGTKGTAIIGTTAFGNLADAFAISGRNVAKTSWGYYSPFDKVTLHLLSDAETAIQIGDRDHNVKLVNDSASDNITITSTLAGGYSLFLFGGDPDYCEYTWGEGITMTNPANVMTNGVFNIDGVIIANGSSSYWPSSNKTIMNISENGAFRYLYGAGTIGAVVNVTGNGESYAEDAQFINTADGTGTTAIGAADTTYTAGITVTKYGYAGYNANVTLGNDAGADAAGTAGTLTLSDHGKFVIGGTKRSLTVGGTKSGATGTVTMSNGSVLEVSGDLIVNATTGTITMDASSQISFGGTWSQSGTFTVSMKDASEKIYTLVDNTGSNAMTLENYNVTLTDNTDNNFVLTVADNDLFVYDKTKFDFTKIVLSGDWTSKAFGDVITVDGTDYYYGITAFSDVGTAFKTAGAKSVELSKQVTLTVVNTAASADDAFISFGIDGFDVKLAGYSSTGADTSLTVGIYGQDDLAGYSNHFGKLTVDASLDLFKSVKNFGIGGDNHIYTKIEAGEVFALDGVNSTDKTANVTVYAGGYFADGGYANLTAWTDATVNFTAIGDGEAFGELQLNISMPWTVSNKTALNITAKEYGVGQFKAGDTAETYTLGKDGAFSLTLDQGKFTSDKATVFDASAVVSMSKGSQLIFSGDVTFNTGATVTMDKDSQVSFGGTWTKGGTFTISLKDATAAAYTLIDNTGSATMTLEDYGVTIADQGDYTVAVVNNDLIAYNAANITDVALSSNIPDEAKVFGADVVIGGQHYNYGITAYDSATGVNDVIAANAAKSRATNVVVDTADAANAYSIAGGATVNMSGTQTSKKSTVQHKDSSHNVQDAAGNVTTTGYTLNMTGSLEFSYLYMNNNSTFNFNEGSYKIETFNNYGSGNVNVAEDAEIAVGSNFNVLGNVVVNGTIVGNYTMVYAGKLDGALTPQSGHLTINKDASVSTGAGVAVIGDYRDSKQKYSAVAKEGDVTTATIDVNGGTLLITNDPGTNQGGLQVGGGDSGSNGILNVTGGTVTAASGATFSVTAKGTVNMDAASKFSFGGTWSQSGTFNVDMKDATAVIYKLIDNTGSAAMTLENYNVTLTNNTDNKYVLAVSDNDLVAYDKTQIDMTNLVVSSNWATGYNFGDVIMINGTAYYYGISAFSDVGTAFKTAGANSVELSKQVTLTVVNTAASADDAFISFGTDGFDVKLAGYSTSGADTSLTVGYYGQDDQNDYTNYFGKLTVDASLDLFKSVKNFGIGGDNHIYTKIEAGEVFALDGVNSTDKTANVTVYAGGCFSNGTKGYANLTSWPDATVNFTAIGDGEAFGDVQLNIPIYSNSNSSPLTITVKEYGVGQLSTTELPRTYSFGDDGNATFTLDQGKLTASMPVVFGSKAVVSMSKGSQLIFSGDVTFNTGATVTMDKDSQVSFGGTWTQNGSFTIDMNGMDTAKKVHLMVDNTGTTDATYNVTVNNLASGYTSGKTLTGDFAVYDSTITTASVLLTKEAYEFGEAITVTVDETEKTYYYGLNAIQSSTLTALPSGATEYVFEDGVAFNSASGISVSTDNTVFVGLGENGGSITATSGTALTIAAEINVTVKGVLTIPTVLAGDVTVVTIAEGATLKGTAITTGDTAEVKLSNGITLNDTTITAGSGIATTITINGAVTMEGTSMISVDAGSAGAIIQWDLTDGSSEKADYSIDSTTLVANISSTATQLYISLKGASGADQALGNYTLLTNVDSDPKNNTYFMINGVAKTIGDSVTLRQEGEDAVKATLVYDANAKTVSLSVALWPGRLVVNAGETKDVSNMTFSGLGGVLVGGAIHNSGTVTGTGTSFLNNTGSDGGAVYNQGTMTLTDVTFSGNQASTNGTVNNKKNATMTLKNATFTNNTAKQIGGAIYNGGTMTIEDSTFTGNIATGSGVSHGGAITSGTAAETTGKLTIKNTTFTNNSAERLGGALAVFNEVDLTDVTFSGNSSIFGGAVVMNGTGKLTLDNVTFDGNTVSGTGAVGGAIYAMAGATITMNGDVTLADDTDTIVFAGAGELVWNVTADKYGFISHYSKITFGSATRTITVGSDVAAGDSFTLAGDAASAASQTFTVRSGESSGSVTVGGSSVTVGDYAYKLEVDGSDQLMLSVKATITEKMVTVSGSYMYNGTAQEATVTVKLGDTELVRDQDYTISFSNNTDAGTASFAVTGMGDYEGTYNGTFTIAKRDVTVTSGSASQVYDGTTLTNDTVTVSGTGFVDGEGAAYNVTGSQTEIGTSNNTFTYTLNDGTKAANYDIFCEEGELTVLRPAKSDYNKSAVSDVVQTNASKQAFITYDDGDSWAKTGAVWGLGDWAIEESRFDFTGDSKSDMLISDSHEAGVEHFAALINQDTSLTFAHQDIRGFYTSDWGYFGAGDINGDGIDDVVMIETKEHVAAGSGRCVNAWLIDNDGTYGGDKVLGGLSDDWKAIGIADVNGDGIDNVILHNDNGWVGFWGTYDGVGEVTMIKFVQNRTLLGTGDMDGDFAEDLLWKYDGDDTVWAWTNLKDGEGLTDTRLGRIQDVGGSWTISDLGDYDGDGTDEILWTDSNQKLAFSEATKEGFSVLKSITIA